MKIPSFLLRRLYVKSSLIATSQGFEFQLRNSLGSGYARSVLPLKVDSQIMQKNSTSFVIDGQSVNFDDVDEETPFTLGMNKTTTIKCSCDKLAAGSHTIEMSFEVAGLGVLSFSFTDAII